MIRTIPSVIVIVLNVSKLTWSNNAAKFMIFSSLEEIKQSFFLNVARGLSDLFNSCHHSTSSLKKSATYS